MLHLVEFRALFKSLCTLFDNCGKGVGQGGAADGQVELCLTWRQHLGLGEDRDAAKRHQRLDNVLIRTFGVKEAG